jgi:hypothetical protein
LLRKDIYYLTEELMIFKEVQEEKAEAERQAVEQSKRQNKNGVMLEGNL